MTMNVNMTRRSLVASALAAPFALTCCSAQTGGDAGTKAAGFTPALDKGTAGELRVVGNYNNFEALEGEFDRFAKIYPNVQASYTYLDNYNSSIAPALSGSDAPDIFCGFSWMAGRPDYDELFSHAEDLSSQDLKIDVGAVRESLLSPDSAGRVLMIPVLSSTYGMIVNEDILKKEGLEVPKTLTALQEVCQRLKQAGYVSPIVGYNKPKNMWQTLANPHIYKQMVGNESAVQALNSLTPSAGEFVRPTLEYVRAMVERCGIDLPTCDAVGDDYDKLILRFFEGDIPMILGSAETMSGTAKREHTSKTFENNPFSYSFRLIPANDDGLFSVDNAYLLFAVNATAQNLSIANEFMRFLISTEELNELARVKGVLTASAAGSDDPSYSALNDVNNANVVSSVRVGLSDGAITQVRLLAYEVGNGRMSVDDAVAAYGTIEG